jgi:hypothetical protein
MNKVPMRFIRHFLQDLIFLQNYQFVTNQINSMVENSNENHRCSSKPEKE